MTTDLRPGLGEHAEALIADRLEKREESIIKAVVAKLANGPLEPHFAVQQWVALAEARKLRASLVRQTQVERQRVAGLIGGEIDRETTR